MTMSTSTAAIRLPGPVPGAGLAPGIVEVSVIVPAAAEQVWTALTQPDVVGQWFGNLSGPLEPGGSCRLDFGDGDFFEITDVVLRPPYRLSYAWRFLGTGPKNAISWVIEPQGDNCRVVVTDAEPSRTPEGVAELTEGWTDFLQRLQAFCATGRNARYAWRREFDGAIELSIEPQRAFELLLSADGQKRWMPWSTQAIAAGATVTMRDGRLPATLTIGAVERIGATALRFALTCPEWNAPTECMVKTQPAPQGALLVIAHNGWQDISAHDGERAEQRARFGSLWTQALHRAQELARQKLS